MATKTPWLQVKAEYLNGVTPKEIGKKYGVTAKQVSDKAYQEGWMNDKAKMLENVRKNTEKKIESLTILALKTLEEIIKEPYTDHSVKVSACRSVLDVSGLKSSKVEQTNINKEPLKVEIIE